MAADTKGARRRLSRLALVAFGLAAIGPVSAQAAPVVTAPTRDAATLRARLARTMAPPGRPLPTDAAELDAMLARGVFVPLAKRLREAPAMAAIILDLNWEQARILDGAGFALVYAYMTDLWRTGSSLSGPEGDELKQSAAMMFTYALDLVRLDGVRCADASAPGHRQDQIVLNRPLVDCLRGLSREKRMTLGTVSLAIESATAPLRRDGAVLCSGGLDRIGAGLKANGDKPLPPAPTAPGQVDRTCVVPSAPGYKPGSVALSAWQPRQAAIRASMPALLTALFSVPTDAASSGQ